MNDSTRDRIWAEILRKNPRIDYGVDVVEFSDPRPSTHGGMNTAFDITAKAGTGYYNTSTYYYDRIDWADYIASFAIDEIRVNIIGLRKWREIVAAVLEIEPDHFVLSQDDFDIDLNDDIPSELLKVGQVVTLPFSRRSWYHWGQLDVTLALDRFGGITNPIL